MLRKFLAILIVLSFVAFPGNAAVASSPYQQTLGSNTGFTGGTSFTIASAAATILPAIPSGCHEAWIWSETPFNYGDANVSTGTYEMWWGPSTEVTASGTTILYRSQPLVLDKFVTPNPTVYFRVRGTDTDAKTVYVRYR